MLGFAKKEHDDNVLYAKSAFKNTLQNSKNSYQKRNSKVLQNPLDSDGNISKRRIFDSKFHKVN